LPISDAREAFKKFLIRQRSKRTTMETKELNESENPTIKTTGESFSFFG